MMELRPGGFADLAYTAQKDRDGKEYYCDLDRGLFSLKPPVQASPRGGIL
jgi:hypothetical protein